MLLSGKEFNEKYQDKQFYKLTNATNKHFGMVYQEGENIDVKKLNINDCTTGMYFFETSKMFHFYKSKYTHVRTVTIPEDAEVIVRQKSFRTNKFILGPSVAIENACETIAEFIKQTDLTIRTDSPFFTKYVNHPNLNKQFFLLLTEITMDFCGFATIKCKKFNTEERHELITENPNSILLLDDPTYEEHLLALSLNGNLLKQLNLYNFMTKQNTFFGLIPKKYFEQGLNELLKTAVQQNYKAIKYVQDPTDEICKIAFQQSMDADNLIEGNISDDVANFALSMYPELILKKRYHKYYTNEIVTTLVSHNPNFFELIPKEFQTEELCIYALQIDIKNCRYLDDRFMHLVRLNI